MSARWLWVVGALLCAQLVPAERARAVARAREVHKATMPRPAVAPPRHD